MGKVEGGLDVQTDEAWAGLVLTLSQVMEALEPGSFLCIGVDVWWSDEPLDGAIPYVQVMRLKDGVHVEASSNHYLASRFRLGKGARRRLRSLGLNKPGAKGVQNYWATFGLNDLDAAGRLLVSALREGFGVIHPAFLSTDEPDLAALLHQDVTDVVDVARAQGEARELLRPVPGEELATYPDDAAHLQDLVIQALTPMVGDVPEPDGDGDFAVRADTSVVFVRVAPNMPLVTLHAEVVVDVGDEQAAVLEVGLLNRDTPGVQFLVTEGVVGARMVLPAVPFVPTVFRAMLERMLHVLPRVDKDLARRVGGRVFLDGLGPDGQTYGPSGGSSTGDRAGGRGHRWDAVPDAEKQRRGAGQDPSAEWTDKRFGKVLDRMHPVLVQLVMTDAEEPGSVRPRTVAELCGSDPRVMRKVVRSSLRAESALRSRRREAASRNDEHAADLFRYFRKRTRRIRATVEEALRRAERDGRTLRSSGRGSDARSPRSPRSTDGSGARDRPRRGSTGGKA